MPYIANPLEGLPIRNSFIVDQASLGEAAAQDDTLLVYDISATALKQLTVANLQAGILASPTFTGVPAGPTANAGTNTTQLATTAFVTTATTALNTITEMTDVTISSIGSGEILKWNGSAWINNTLAEAGIITASSPTFTGTITIGSAVMSEADLEQIDDLTAGTAVASKALVVDSNKDIGTIRNLTIDGTFSDGNYTFDTSGNVSGLGTIGSGAITSSGIVTGTGFTAGGAVLAEAELELLDGLTAGTAIATKVVTTDGNIDTTGQRNLTISGELDAATLDISGNADIDGTLEADVITVDGVALATYIRDTVGTNMLSSNTESGIAVTYDTSNDNIDFALETAQTSLVTIYNAALKAGRDTDNLIDFATTDNEIILRVNGANEVRLGADVLTPVTSDGIALGTGSLMWSDLFLAAGGVINFNNSNMTITHTSAGLLTVAGGTLATAALTTSTIVASGIVKTDDATEATTTTDGSLQTDGGLSVVKDAVFGDDVKLLSDSAVLSFGADGDTTLTHTDGTGIGLNGTNKITFNDASQFIQGASNAILALGATDEIDLTATAIDINGNADVSGSLTAGSYVGLPASNLTTSGIAELATTAEINTGTDSTRIMPIDQYVGSHRNTRYILYRIVGADTDVEVATTVGGDFEFPFAGTVLAAGTFNDTAGSSGTQIVDIHKAGSTIMSSDKCDTASGAKSSRGSTTPGITTAAIAAGDIITFDVDAVHSTAAKGLTVRIEVRVT